MSEPYYLVTASSRLLSDDPALRALPALGLAMVVRRLTYWHPRRSIEVVRRQHALLNYAFCRQANIDMLNSLLERLMLPPLRRVHAGAGMPVIAEPDLVVHLQERAAWGEWDEDRTRPVAERQLYVGCAVEVEVDLGGVMRGVVLRIGKSLLTISSDDGKKYRVSPEKILACA